MAPSTIRKAIGTVKDQTSIGIAKVASNVAPDLEVAIMKATSHDDDPTNEKHVREILILTSYSRGYVHACVSAVSKRLGKTHDWIVALKALVLIHRLLNEGDLLFREEILYRTRRGAHLLNMSDFQDEAHSSSWDHSAFVWTYASYLDQRLELLFFDQKLGSQRFPTRSFEYNDFGEEVPRRTRSRSFGDVSEVERGGRVGTKQIDELVLFYNWCKDTGVARSSEYPEVQRITGKLLETLEEFVRDHAKRGNGKSPARKVVEEKNDASVVDETVPDGQPQVTSAWQNPATEPRKADWELALVETASHLEK